MGIGVVTHRRPDLFSPYFRHVLSGLRAVWGRSLRVNPRGGAVAGWIWVAPEGSPSSGLKRRFGRQPVVVLNGRSAGRPSVDVNNRRAAQAAAAQLFSRGHRRVAVLKGKMDTVNGRERWRGVRAAFRAAHRRPVVVAEARFDRRRAEGIVAAWFKEGLDFTAVVAANDAMALGARDAAQRAGRRLALVGFDDVPEARKVGLSTVSVPLRVLSQRAGHILKKWIRTGVAPPRTTVGPSRLIVRASSGWKHNER